MTAWLFIGYVVLMAAIVIAVIGRYLGGRAAFSSLGCLVVWFVYVGLISYCGVVRNTTMRPPGVVLILGPMVVFVVGFIIRSTARLAAAFPLWIILAMQTFRVGVELFLHQLWIEGLVPKMLTFEGANVDIYIGATAPLVAWLSMRGRGGLRIALAWNLVGLLALTNVVVRAVLTSPGPLNLIHAERANQLIGTFPYSFVPGFFVPLAIVLHVLALQSLRQSERGLVQQSI